MEKGILLVVSGPAGSGKSTVDHELEKQYGYVYSVSATSRSPRENETDGVDYHYLTRDQFVEKIKAGDLVEYTEYCNNYYGPLKSETDAALQAGKTLILEIEVEGASNIKKKYPDAILVMLLPPSFKAQEERLRARNSETEESIASRLNQTKKELTHLNMYDYVVYNRDGDYMSAVKTIASIVEAEKHSTKRNPDAEKKYFEN